MDTGDVPKHDTLPGRTGNHQACQVARRLFQGELAGTFCRKANSSRRANKELGRLTLQNLSARGTGCSFQLALQIRNGQPAGCEGRRIHGDLKLRSEAAHAGHFGHPFHRGELMLDLPILQIAKLAQIVAGSFHGVPEDLSRGRRIRRKSRSDSGRQIPLERGQAFPHLAAGSLQARAVLEDHVDHRVVEITGPAQRANSGNSLQPQRERMGHLVFDILGAVTLPGGEDDDLRFR